MLVCCTCLENKPGEIRQGFDSLGFRLFGEIMDNQIVKFVVYYCQKCKKHFKESDQKLGCLVNHSPDDCCHHGDKEVTEQEIPLLLLSFVNSNLTYLSSLFKE